MGYYIQTKGAHGKAKTIAEEHGGELVPCPRSYKDIPLDKGLVVVMDNGPFEAAGFAYNEDEFLAFTDPSDSRPKEFVLLDRATARQLSGYRGA